MTSGVAAPPTDYGAAIAVMQFMNWSWNDYLEADADLVWEIEAIIVAKNKAEPILAKRAQG